MPASINLRERDNLRASEIILARDLSHCGEHLEEGMGRIAPGLFVPGDEEEASAKLPLGLILNEDCGRTSAHADTPTGGFGIGHRGEILISIKPVVAPPFVNFSVAA
jgi:hypothetical protein